MRRTKPFLLLIFAASALVAACAGRVPAPHADATRAEPGNGRVGAHRVDTSVAPNATSASAAVDVLRRYYAAIDARNFRRAYVLWGGAGAASGQAFKEFAAGFADTARVRVEPGEPGRIEPAAGSRYVTVPVVIRAVTRGGEEQRFEGTYTLRRSVVTGASAEQRHWHIYSAEITRVR